jgi:hypothetical protein
MPYISKLERERQRARQEEQTERARWFHFKDAVTCVQEKEGCTAESAAEQLIAAIIDQALAAKWDDMIGGPITPSDFGGTVEVCLDGVGFVKRNYETANSKSIARSTRKYPTPEFVNGPVIDADMDLNGPLTKVNTLTYIPLLVSKEDMDQWPLDDSNSKAHNTGNKPPTRRPTPPSVTMITEAARTVYRDNPFANIVVAEKLIRKQLPGATRNLIRPVLNRPEFQKQRRRPGKQPKL